MNQILVVIARPQPSHCLPRIACDVHAYTYALPACILYDMHSMVWI